ncbi:AI-2E family transporter [Caenispirillum salinarum]|uniref:AI-2E family transporter n=1 Tax=Caenispirillum salinarum TaxID=859058 RepID=UPI00384CD245
MTADRAFGPFLKRLAAILVTVALVALVLQLSALLLMIFGGILIAVILRAGANAAVRWTGVNAKVAVLLVVLAVVVVVGVAGTLMGAQVASEFARLLEQLPAAVDHAESWLRGLPWVEQMLRQSDDGGGDIFSRVTSVASTAMGAVTNLLVALIVALFLALDPGLYQRGVLHLFPVDKRQRVGEVLLAVAGAMRDWMKGQVIVMLAVGAMTFVGLMVLGAPLPIALAVLSGLLNFIPFIGPVLAAIPAVLVALGDSPHLGLWVALLYLVVQQIEGNILQPLIQKRAVALPPALTIFTAVAMGVLLGFPGMVLATPLLVALFVIVRMAYVEDVLGDQISGPPKEEDGT